LFFLGVFLQTNSYWHPFSIETYSHSSSTPSMLRSPALMRS
jgi:hypothetical protein